MKNKNLTVDRVMKKITSLFADETPTDVKTADGRILRLDTATPAVDTAVQEVTEDGVVDLEDGDYTLEDETVITVVSGKITVVTPKVEETDTDTPVVETMKFSVIKQISKWDMTVDNETFEVGAKVTMSYVDEVTGETITNSAYSGTYELEDGRMITLDNEGVILVITDAAGVVLEAPVVGDNVEMMGAVDKLVDAFSKLKDDNANLKKEIEALKKAPSTAHTKQKLEFFSEDTKKDKDGNFKSPLHAMLK